ncbi:MAG: hypothetical protein D6753_16760 [Planctomycetota bacterium]|nr:MAG: hypothetical protein D6753_16760 [Planctomycetota bacterium]
MRWTGLVWAICIAWPVAVSAHPFHISVAEAEWNADAQCLEVSLKLQPTDLERALARLAGKRIRVEEEQADPWIEKYLQANFRCTEEQGRPAAESQGQSAQFSKVKLVGKEIGVAWMWVYFEVRWSPDKRPQTLVDTILLEVNEAQINTVVLRSGPQRRALKFTARQWWHAMDWEWLTRQDTVDISAKGEQ